MSKAPYGRSEMFLRNVIYLRCDMFLAERDIFPSEMLWWQSKALHLNASLCDATFTLHFWESKTSLRKQLHSERKFRTSPYLHCTVTISPPPPAVPLSLHKRGFRLPREGAVTKWLRENAAQYSSAYFKVTMAPSVTLRAPPSSRRKAWYNSYLFVQIQPTIEFETTIW